MPRNNSDALGPIAMGVFALVLMFGPAVGVALWGEDGSGMNRTDAMNLRWLVVITKLVAGVTAVYLVLASESVIARICGWIVIVFWILQLVLLTLG